MTVKVHPLPITIRDLIQGYHDGGEDNQVSACNGKLNIRPAFQRQFVYDNDKRDKVLQSVYNNLPLNSIYWAVNQDGSYEVIDGQQRIISICQFCTNDDGEGNPVAIKFNDKFAQTFDGLRERSPEHAELILNYPLNVYLCEGTPDEKLDWFHTINIQGELMNEQELRNADYTGAWLTDAKSYFSKKKNNLALAMAFYDNKEKNTLIALTPENINRQALLELVLSWIINSNPALYANGIVDYMAKHCQDNDASELKNYFQAVVRWVKSVFPQYRKDMKGLDWGILYNKYHEKNYDPDALQAELDRLNAIYDEDPDGLHKSNFYEYVLSKDRSLIWRRAFSEKQQRQVYKNQQGYCASCHRTLGAFDAQKYEAHHIIAYKDGGETTIENCLLLCHDCHADITARQNQNKKL